MLQIHEVWDFIHKHPPLILESQPKANSLFARFNQINKKFFIHFFVVVIIELTLVSLFAKVHDLYFPDLNVYSHTFAWVYLTIVALPMVYLIYRHHIPYNYLGIRYKNAYKSSLEALLFTTIIATIICFYKDWGIGDLAKLFFTPWAIIYLLHSYIQEIIARGMLQGVLCRLMADSHPIYPISLTSIIFSLFHLQFGLSAVLLTFIAGIVLGLIYQREQNLMGVTIIHSIIGWIAFGSKML